MMQTAVLPSDWQRNPGMALRTARIACFEHESLEAMIDVCPPQNSEGLFDVNEDSWAIAKLYTSHDSLEGVQFRTQMEIESVDEMPIVVRELADVYYAEYASDGQSSLPAPTPWERQSKTESPPGENHSLDDFE